MGGKGGVVSAAVFHVKNQCKIQNRGFQTGVLAVRTEQIEYVFCG